MNKAKENTSDEQDGHVGDAPITLSDTDAPLPSRFSELKQQLIPDDAARERLVDSWKSLLAELKGINKGIKEEKQNIIPQVKCSDFINLKDGSSLLEEIKKRGVVVIRGVVSSREASEWKENAKSYIKLNPSVTGYPPQDPQIFELYWTPSQVAARAHPSFLTTAVRLNTLFKAPPGSAVSLENPVTYADRLRIRHPGDRSFVLPPHIDGGGIERWEDWEYSQVYKAILDGRWTDYDAYDLTHRLNAKFNLYDKPTGCSIFRTFQGWLSISTTGPNEGTLCVYPSLRHSTAYTLLRPFFRPISQPVLPETESTRAAFLHPDNWKLDLDSPEFPGSDFGWRQTLTDITHPHLELEHTMIPMPTVEPGDCVFWTCDSIHSVEAQHNGTEESAVIYVPAVPLTVPNAAYMVRQRDAFIAGKPGPDFPKGPGEVGHVCRGMPEHIVGLQGKRAMGFEVFAVGDGMDEGAKRAVREANEILGV